jgi:hypothetical protein
VVGPTPDSTSLPLFYIRDLANFTTDDVRMFLSSSMSTTQTDFAGLSLKDMRALLLEPMHPKRVIGSETRHLPAAKKQKRSSSTWFAKLVPWEKEVVMLRKFLANQNRTQLDSSNSPINTSIPGPMDGELQTEQLPKPETKPPPKKRRIFPKTRQ